MDLSIPPPEPVFPVPQLPQNCFEFDTARLREALHEGIAQAQEDTPTITLTIGPTQQLKLSIAAYKTLHDALEKGQGDALLAVTPDRNSLYIQFNQINDEGDCIPMRFHFDVLP